MCLSIDNMKSAPVFFYALVMLRLFKVANYLDYFYLVIVVLAIEAIAPILNLHHKEIMAFCVSWCVCMRACGHLFMCVCESAFECVLHTRQNHGMVSHFPVQYCR